MYVKISSSKNKTDFKGVLHSGKGLFISDLNRLSNRPDHHRVYIIDVIASFICQTVILKSLSTLVLITLSQHLQSDEGL